MDSLKLQMQVRENAEDTRQFLNDLSQWETEMKKKDAEISGKELPVTVTPAVRNKKRPKRNEHEKKKEKKISSYDYSAWEKFDVEKACKEIDKEEENEDESVTDLAMDQELDQQRQKAIYEKDLGNLHFRKNQWDKAIDAYSRAVDFYNQDGTFYANRGMCYIKKQEWFKAEADLTRAISLDPSYVKAFYRRGLVRVQSGRLLEARHDFVRGLELDSQNVPCKTELEKLDKRIKELQLVIPKESNEVNEFEEGQEENLQTNDVENNKQIQNIKNTIKVNRECKNNLGEYNPKEVVNLINKPPHLRSKEHLIRLEIEEADELMIEKITSEMNARQSNQENNESLEKNDIETKTTSPILREEVPTIGPEPSSAGEFINEWRNIRNYPDLKYQYLKQIDPKNIPKLFNYSLESQTLSSILEILESHFLKAGDPVILFLEGFSKVQRFQALVLFLTDDDKTRLKNLLEYSKRNSHSSDFLVKQISNNFQL